jgi:hypothetical protein
MAKMENLISTLRASLSPASVILTPEDAKFVAALARWSHIDLETPAAVVQPANEEDALNTASRNPPASSYYETNDARAPCRSRKL